MRNNLLHLVIAICLMAAPVAIEADELVHKFKSPSFSGIGTSSHYLTIENQEKIRRDAIKDDIDAALLAAQRAEEKFRVKNICSAIKTISRTTVQWRRKYLRILYD